MVTVVHGKLNAAKCSVVQLADEHPAVGTTANFSIVSKDSFGNTRYVRASGVHAN